jgi:hypothetical protein
MKNLAVVLMILLCGLMACTKSANSPAPNAGPETAPASNSVRQKLMEYSGASPTDCGRLDVHATPDQLKAASDCAQTGNQKKQPFIVTYEMPGMTVGVAGSAEGKLFTVQTQGEGASATLTSAPCPAQLRIAASGRVTCYAPGNMGSMGAGHAAMPPGMPNPHAAGAAKPSSNKP